LQCLQSKYSHISDQDLLQKFYQEQNNQWLGILLQRYTLLVLGVCMKYLKNEEKARDATQQVAYKVLYELQKYRVDHFKSWLYMVAKNHCLMQLRNAHMVLDIDNVPSDKWAEEEFDKEHHLQREITLHHMELSIDELSKEQRTCIQLFFYNKKSYVEISRETGYTVQQVKSYIQNGKRNLKILLDKKMHVEKWKIKAS